jgi:hypothetical protein
MANPLVASIAKTTLRMKISFRRQPLFVDSSDATQTGRVGSRQLTMLREVFRVSNSRLDHTQLEGPFRERNAARRGS